MSALIINSITQKKKNRGFTYYKIENLDNRISNADQLLTTDIDKFCESVTDVYSNVSKPILDIVLYVYRLTMTLGGKVTSEEDNEGKTIRRTQFLIGFFPTDTFRSDAVFVDFGCILNTNSTTNR